MGRFRSVKTVEALLRDALSTEPDLKLSIGYVSSADDCSEVSDVRRREFVV